MARLQDWTPLTATTSSAALDGEAAEAALEPPASDPPIMSQVLEFPDDPIECELNQKVDSILLEDSQPPLPDVSGSLPLPDVSGPPASPQPEAVLAAVEDPAPSAGIEATKEPAQPANEVPTAVEAPAPPPSPAGEAKHQALKHSRAIED